MLWAGLSGWNSDGGNDEETVSSLASAALAPSLLQGLQGTGNPLSGRMVALDGDVVRLIAYGADWRDSLRFRAAGSVVALGQTTEQRDRVAANPYGAIEIPGGNQSQVSGEVLDANPYLEEATWLITIYCCIGDSTGAYCPVEEGDRATKSGTSAQPGTVACDPARLGQFLRIGNEEYQCLDTGDAVRGNHVDVWFYDCGDQQDPAPGTGWAWLAEVGTQAVVEVVRCQD